METSTQHPFSFLTMRTLLQHTGFRARNISQFMIILQEIDDWSIFLHIHHAFRRHQVWTVEWVNDFSQWLMTALGEDEIATEIMNLDFWSFASIQEIREAMLEILNQKKWPRRTVPPHRGFHFLTTRNFVIPLDYSAYSLVEFSNCLKQISPLSIFYHVFVAKIVYSRGMNDFSSWILETLKPRGVSTAVEIVNEIENINPYVISLETYRDRLLRILSPHVLDSVDDSEDK
ncbi:MAG: DUF5752 family protein [Candidatus Thorarchaeota archaeon]